MSSLYSSLFWFNGKPGSIWRLPTRAEVADIAIRSRHIPTSLQHPRIRKRFSVWHKFYPANPESNEHSLLYGQTVLDRFQIVAGTAIMKLGETNHRFNPYPLPSTWHRELDRVASVKTVGEGNVFHKVMALTSSSEELVIGWMQDMETSYLIPFGGLKEDE